jgi:hypothetical protein
MAWRSRGKGDLPLVGGVDSRLLPETPKKRLAGKSNCRYHNSADWRGKGNLQQVPAAFNAFRLGTGRTGPGMDELAKPGRTSTLFGGVCEIRLIKNTPVPTCGVFQWFLGQ